MPAKTPVKLTEQNTGSGLKISKLALQTFEVTVKGTSPLVVHAWSEKAKRQMLENMQKTTQTAKAKGKKERDARDPIADYNGARYRINDKTDGFPAVSFKSACAIAARDIMDIKRGLIFQSFHIINGHPSREAPGGSLLPLKYKDISMREDLVRVGMGASDLRYRPEYTDWSTTLRIRYNASMTSVEEILNLLSTAGFAVGIGEMRPGKTGFSNGMFEVDYSSVKVAK
jgi:hypothetical protein